MPQPSPPPCKLNYKLPLHIMGPNNLDPVPILVKFFPQQLIATTANNLPTIDVLAFANPMGEFFRVLELKFMVKSSEIFL